MSDYELMDMRDLLLEGPDGQIADFVKDTIREWSDKPTALEILKSLDAGVHGGGVSEFTLGVLDTLLVLAIKQENTTYDDVVKQAIWRNE